MKASIIVPNLEPQGVLLPSIQALCAQTAEDYEVLLPLCGFISEEDKVILKHFEEQYPNFRTVKTQGERSASLNQAAAQADGKMLFFVESHCIVDNNWLKRYYDRIKRKNLQVAFIEIKEVPSNIWVSKCVWRQRADVVKRLKGASHYDYFFDLHSSCITREIFDSMGGFSEDIPSMAEFEFGAKLHQKGIKVHLIPEEKVWHFNNRKLSSYELIVKRQGRDRARMFFRNGRDFNERYFPNPTFIKLLPLLKTFRLPAMCTAQMLLFADWAGFKGLEKISPSLSESFFRKHAANSLRHGILKALGEKR